MGNADPVRESGAKNSKRIVACGSALLRGATKMRGVGGATNARGLSLLHGGGAHRGLDVTDLRDLGRVGAVAVAGHL
jgi:hypothetical protein